MPLAELSSPIAELVPSKSRPFVYNKAAPQRPANMLPLTCVAQRELDTAA